MTFGLKTPFSTHYWPVFKFFQDSVGFIWGQHGIKMGSKPLFEYPKLSGVICGTSSFDLCLTLFWFHMGTRQRKKVAGMRLERWDKVLAETERRRS